LLARRRGELAVSGRSPYRDVLRGGRSGLPSSSPPAAAPPVESQASPPGPGAPSSPHRELRGPTAAAAPPRPGTGEAGLAGPVLRQRDILLDGDAPGDSRLAACFHLHAVCVRAPGGLAGVRAQVASVLGIPPETREGGWEDLSGLVLALPGVAQLAGAQLERPARQPLEQASLVVDAVCEVLSGAGDEAGVPLRLLRVFALCPGGLDAVATSEAPALVGAVLRVPSAPLRHAALPLLANLCESPGHVPAVARAGVGRALKPAGAKGDALDWHWLVRIADSLTRTGAGIRHLVATKAHVWLADGVARCAAGFLVLEHADAARLRRVAAEVEALAARAEARHGGSAVS